MSREQLSKYRIRGVDRATPAQLLEPVTCLAIDNMVPVGPPENPYWTVPRPEEDVYQSGTALDIGTYADPPDAPGTTDLLILESDRLLRVDRSTGSSTTLYTFDTEVQIQGATFSQLDDAVYVAVRTSGIQNGEPHNLLVVRGTDCYEWAPPQLPRLGVYASSHGTGTELIGSDQRVGMTYAFIFKDGSVGPFAMPSVINPTGGGATPKVYVQAEAGWTTEEQAFVQQHVDRIGIFMNGPLPDGSFSKWASVAWSGPYYQVAEIPATGSVDTETDVSIAPQDLSGQTTRIDDNILAWRPAAGAVYTYNGRLILGDVTYQQPIPNALHHVNESSAGETTADVNVRVGYVYDLGNETVERISDPVTVPQSEIQSGTDEDYVQGGVGQIDLEGQGKSKSSYFGNYHPWPDERVKRLRLYVAGPGASSYVRVYDEEYGTLYGQADAEAVQFWRAFVEIPSGGEPDMPDVATTNAESSERGGRILYSEPYQPGYLKAENRADVDGRILALTSTGEPVSEGQFGQYPLLALCENSLWSLEVSSDPFISGISPLETDAGITGRAAYANVGGQIIGATQEGIRQLTPRPQGEPLSAPLHDIEGRFLTSLGPATVIGHFTDDSAGRRELWVSAGGRTWVYSLPHGTWSSISRARVSYARPAGQLHAITSNRDAVRETSSSDAEQPFSIVSTVFHVGEVGMMERLRQILIQQRFNCEELNWELVAKDPNAALVLDQSSLSRATLPDGLVARDLLPNVQIDKGTLVRGDIGTIYLEKALGYSWFIRMEGTAKPDQGIEAWGAVSKPRRRSRAPSMFPDQPETAVHDFTVSPSAGDEVGVELGPADSDIAGILWGDGELTTSRSGIHLYETASTYTVQVIAQPDFTNVTNIRYQGPVDATTIDHTEFPDLTEISIASTQGASPTGSLTDALLANATSFSDEDGSLTGDLSDFPDRYQVVRLGRGGGYTGAFSDAPAQATDLVLDNTQIQGETTAENVPDGLALLYASQDMVLNYEGLRDGATDQDLHSLLFDGGQYTAGTSPNALTSTQPIENTRVRNSPGSLEGMSAAPMVNLRFTAHTLDQGETDFSQASDLERYYISRRVGPQQPDTGWAAGELDATITALYASRAVWSGNKLNLLIGESGGPNSAGNARSLSVDSMQQLIGVGPYDEDGIIDVPGFNLLRYSATWSYAIRSIDTAADEIRVDGTYQTEGQDAQTTKINTWYPDAGTWELRMKDRFRSGELMRLLGGSGRTTVTISSATYDAAADETVITVQEDLQAGDATTLYGYTPITTYV